MIKRAIQSAKIFSVNMNSFEATIKCPTCNAVITDSSGDDETMTHEICRLMSTDYRTVSLTNVVAKDIGT